ncbi:MAG: cysteine desulfurase [Stomatobaculum sp.]|nr:cysteine desulfurase [Stomatobaculum sp.]
MIYMDHAATTPLSPEVLEAMLPWLKEGYGNASALYPLGLRSAAAIDKAREYCAAVIGAEPGEIYFTSGGSESDNWALVKTAEKYAPRGGHIITTAMEHHAILNTCRYLESRDYEVTRLKPDSEGQIRPGQVEAAIRKNTFLVSIMTANNEIGAVQPVREIGVLCREKKILFHTDAVQAFGHIPIDVKEDKIDLLSASGHKFNGPKGTGFLYMRKGLRLPPLISGGQQERGRRAGTENVAGIVGLGEAARIAGEALQERMRSVTEVRNYLINRMLESVPEVTVNGGMEHRLPNNLNFCFRGIDGERFLLKLSERGICASAGSACASGSSEPSHVLRSIGLSHEQAMNSLRFTIGHDTTREEADEVVKAALEIAAEMRAK